jgi:hypothetical protein
MLTLTQIICYCWESKIRQWSSQRIVVRSLAVATLLVMLVLVRACAASGVMLLFRERCRQCSARFWLLAHGCCGSRSAAIHSHQVLGCRHTTRDARAGGLLSCVLTYVEGSDKYWTSVVGRHMAAAAAMHSHQVLAVATLLVVLVLVGVCSQSSESTVHLNLLAGGP